MNRPNYYTRNKICNWKTPYNPKYRTHRFHRQILPKKNIYQSFSNSSKKLKRGGALPKTFYEANTTLTSKLNKDTTNKENYSPVSLMDIYTKILNKILANRIQQYTKNCHTPQPCRIYPKFTRIIKHMYINVIYHINKRQKPHDHLSRLRKCI